MMQKLVYNRESHMWDIEYMPEHDGIDELIKTLNRSKITVKEDTIELLGEDTKITLTPDKPSFFIALRHTQSFQKLFNYIQKYYGIQDLGSSLLALVIHMIYETSRYVPKELYPIAERHKDSHIIIGSLQNYVKSYLILYDINRKDFILIDQDNNIYYLRKIFDAKALIKDEWLFDPITRNYLVKNIAFVTQPARPLIPDTSYGPIVKYQIYFGRHLRGVLRFYYTNTLVRKIFEQLKPPETVDNEKMNIIYRVTEKYAEVSFESFNKLYTLKPESSSRLIGLIFLGYNKFIDESMLYKASSPIDELYGLVLNNLTEYWYAEIGGIIEPLQYYTGDKRLFYDIMYLLAMTSRYQQAQYIFEAKVLEGILVSKNYDLFHLLLNAYLQTPLWGIEESSPNPIMKYILNNIDTAANRVYYGSLSVELDDEIIRLIRELRVNLND